MSTASGLRVSVVMPAYNEAATIREILRRVAATGLADEIIVVDDGSADGMPLILDELQETYGLTVITHPVNRGKGAALRTGFEAVTGDLVLVQDADLELNPEDYPRLLAPFDDLGADVVFGSRWRTDPRPVGGFWHYVANQFVTWVSNVVNDIHLSDMAVGYKVIRTDVLRQLELQADGFDFESEFTARVARVPDIRIYETAVSYTSRSYRDGKKLRWRDGMQMLWAVLKHGLRR